MFTDTWWDGAAKKNPLRWSKSMSIRALVCELARQDPCRPLRVAVDLDDGELERHFESSESAVHWLRSKFNCEGPPSPASSTQAPWGLASCSTPSLADRDEMVFESSVEPSNNQDSGVQESLDSAPSEEIDGGAHSSDGQEMAVTSHLDEEQACRATMKYMWADAGLLPTQCMQGLAEANPMRWSPAMTPEEVVNDLEAAACHDRPVKIKVDMPGHHEVRTFESKEITVQWICRTFKVCDDEVSPPQQEHICVVCLEKQVSVMMMPCRHAVLCDDCAGPILNGRGSCPICRVQITNHAKGHFTDDYVDLVQAMEARMERTHAAACEGMYNHVRPLMVTGALLGTGAAACFVLAPPAAPILAGSALAVGYLPWFATTVAHFEREDMGNPVAPSSFFTEEDLSQPLTLIAKAVAMAVIAPLAAIVFFIPYGLYAGVVRPVGKGFLHSLVRVCAFAHVYALRPTARGLQVVSEALLSLLRDIGYGAREHAVILGNILASGARSTGDALVTIGRHCGENAALGASKVYDHALVPIGHAFQAGAKVAYENAALGARKTYDHALVPIGHGCQRAAETTYDYVLLPSAKALQKALRALGNACVTAAVNVYSYVLLPSGRGIVLVLQKTGEVIADGASAVYTYMLVPLGNGIASGATMLYSNVLIPLGQGTLRALQMVGNGITLSAEFLYKNVLAPLGRGTFSVLKALGYGTWIVLKGLGIALAGAAVATYEHVLVPTARAMALGASTVYVYVLQPGGKILYECAASTGEAVQAVASAVASGCAAGANGVYVYVLHPSGQAIYVAAAKSSEAAIVCGRGVQSAAKTVIEEARHAVRHSVEALQASSRGFGR
jgi:hypothetical protein